VEWEKHLAAARADLDEMAVQGQCADPARIADGFMVAAGFVPGVTLEANLRDVAQLTWSTRTTKVRMAILCQNHPRSLGGALAKLTALADKDLVMALRERAQEMLPTWKDTLAKRAALMSKPKARWVPFERGDAARLLALASTVTAARSGDVIDFSGRSVPLEGVRTWVAENLDVPSWPVLAFLSSRSAETPEDVAESASGGDAPNGGSASGVALGVLFRLRVASVDRLVREVARVDRTASRESTLHALEGAGDRVRWIGRAVVCAKGPS